MKIGFLLAAAAVAVAGCSSSSSSTDTTPTTPAADDAGAAITTINATESEYGIKLDPATVNAGKVTINVTNKGAAAHELVVFKTDLAPDKMPTKADGTVDEEGPGITHMDPEVENVGAGGSGSAVLDLTPGNYVVLCNVKDHYSKGMAARLVVK